MKRDKKTGRILRSWSEEDEKALKDMWFKGVSSGDIAKAMNKTRGAVMGKLGRMGCLRRRDRPQRKISVKRHKKPIDRGVGSVHLKDMQQGQCRFIPGDALGALYCGDDVYKRQMCKEHFELCYRKPRKKIQPVMLGKIPRHYWGGR